MCHNCACLVGDVLFAIAATLLCICFLATFVELQKATINIVLSVHPSICPSICGSAHMEQLGFHWTDFYEISYLEFFFGNLSRKFKFD